METWQRGILYTMNRRRGEELEGRWSVAIVVVSVAGSSSVPLLCCISHLLCRSLLSSCVTGPTVLLFLLLCSPWGSLLPFLRTSVISVGSILAGFSFVIEATEDVLSAVDTFGNDAGHETFLDSWGDGIL